MSIDPVADTVNAPSSHPPVPQGSTSINNLLGISCDSAGACAAYGTYWRSSDNLQQGLVMPVGGSAFQPQMPATATAQSTTAHPAAHLGAASCAGGSCLIVGFYYDSTNQGHALLDRFGSGGGIADSAPSNNTVALAACGAPAFCVAAATSPYGQPLDVLTAAGWSAPALSLPSDVAAGTQSSAFEQVTACDSATSCWLLGTYSARSGSSSTGAAYADHVTPTPVAVRPSVSVASSPSFALGASVTLAWHGVAGSAPIAHYAVQVRRAAWNGGFGAWSTPSGWGALSSATTSAHVALPIGYDTCVRVQATDMAHLTSAWSSPRCTARPIDDHALTASAGWTRATASGFYLGTYSSTKSLGTTLTRTGVQFDRLALVATKCAACGKVAIYSGTTLIATINLYRASTLRQVLIPLPMVSLRTAMIRLRVVTSGKLVQIDGLGISRT